ncbi:hypothetical protein Tco_0902537 [Tanacetum coccineum]
MLASEEPWSVYVGTSGIYACAPIVLPGDVKNFVDINSGVLGCCELPSNFNLLELLASDERGTTRILIFGQSFWLLR